LLPMLKLGFLEIMLDGCPFPWLFSSFVAHVEIRVSGNHAR